MINRKILVISDISVGLLQKLLNDTNSQSYAEMVKQSSKANKHIAIVLNSLRF